MDKNLLDIPNIFRRKLLAATGLAIVGTSVAGTTSAHTNSTAFVFTADYGSFDDAVSASQQQGQILVINSIVNIDYNYTIPTDIHIRIEKGFFIQVQDGLTLTLNGHIEAGYYKIFELGNSAVIDGQGINMQWKFEWWGAGPEAIDNQPYFQAAMNYPTNVSRQFLLGKVIYKFRSGVITNRRISVFGDMDRSILWAESFSAAEYMFQILGDETNRIQRITWKGVYFRSDNQNPYAIYLQWVNHSKFEDIYLYNLRGGIDGGNAWSTDYKLIQTFQLEYFTFRNLGGCNQTNFYSCQFGGEWGYRSEFQAASINFVACDFENCGYAGIDITPRTGEKISGVKITGGYFENNKYCVYINPVDDEGVIGVDISGIYGYGKSGTALPHAGIVMRRTKGFSITGNMFGGIPNSAINIDTTCKNGVIEANAIDTSILPTPIFFAGFVHPSVRVENNN